MTMEEPTGLRFYDTLTRRKRSFKPIEPGEVKMYVCGPTVYGDPHVGNFRTFIVGDLIRRWLEYRGYDVFILLNLTDIDDKTIRDSGREGIPLKEFTDRYIESFFRGVDMLNLKRATTYPQATEYIPQMIKFIEELVDKGVAYVAKDGVYFDIDKFPDYGKLSGMDLSKVKTTERMAADEYDKETMNDFALWKSSTTAEVERGIYYESPWGEGRPGWHIECSVMIRSILGDTIDIHVGGEDLVFPHHENEIAQSESLTGKLFVRYWMHVRHLMINGRSMSKSLGNYVSFDEVITKFGPEAFRYFLCSVHYRRPLDYTEAAMEIAENSAARLRTTLDLIENAMRQEDKYYGYTVREQVFLDEVNEQRSRFEEAIDDDLDTHGALNALHALSKTVNEYVGTQPNKGVLMKAYVTYRKLLSVLGLFEKRVIQEDDITEALISIIVDIREQLRREKRYDLSDRIREELDKVGVILTDITEGTSWKIEGHQN